MRTRHLQAVLLAVVASLVLAGTAAAGGSATATLDEGSPTEATAGEQVTVGFTLKQHGQTPISWEEAAILAINRDTHEAVYAPAQPEGAEGHYVATVTFPSAGAWDWRIDTRNLLMETRLEPVAVAPGAARPGGAGKGSAEALAAGSAEAAEAVRTAGAFEVFAASDSPLALMLILLGVAVGVAGSVAGSRVARRSGEVRLRTATR